MLLGSPRSTQKAQFAVLSCCLIVAFFFLMVLSMGTFQSWDYERMYTLSSWQKSRYNNGDWKDRINGDRLATMSPQDSSVVSMIKGSSAIGTASTCACTPSATLAGALPPLRDELASNSQDSSKHRVPGSHSTGLHSSNTHVSGQSEWKFDPARDSFDYSLSDSQCDNAFPDYYAEIDRAAMYYKDRGISEDDMNITERGNVVRAMIYDHQLYIMQTHITVEPGIFDLPRMMAILGSIHRVIVAHQGPIPNVEFVFSLADAEWNPAPFWTLCRAPEDESHWVMPDFGYWAWDNKIVGSYQQFVRELEDKSDFSKKKQLAFWRGSDSNEERHDLLRAAEGHEWADIEAIIWGRPGNFTRMVDHCDYQYLVQTEGNSYSGRLKYILNCASVVLMRRPYWIETFTHLLQSSGPDQNVIELDGFVTLPDVMSHHLSHPEDSENIARNAKELLKERYLTPAAQACYWRKMFEKWAKVQSWEPKPWTVEQKSEGEGKDQKVWEEKVWNGVTWELFMLTAYNSQGKV